MPELFKSNNRSATVNDSSSSALTGLSSWVMPLPVPDSAEQTPRGPSISRWALLKILNEAIDLIDEEGL